MGQNNNNVVRFKEMFLSFDIDSIKGKAESLLKDGILPSEILGICQSCMEEIGKKFETGDYYLPELVVSGEMFKQVSSALRPFITTSEVQRKGRIVIGTPKGDIHSLGKDIFRTLAEASGFDVYDLGIDVPPEAFIQKLDETQAPVLGMSALLTTAYAPMQEVIELLEKKACRDQTFVILGGGATTKDIAKRLRADAQTWDAYEGLKIIESYFEKHGVKK